MQHRRYLAVILISFMLGLLIPGVGESKGIWRTKTTLNPDTIIYNGQIRTMEQFPSQVEALAIQGDKISAVGEESKILALAGPNTRLINLGGKTLLPGFIDAHSHWIGDRNNVNQSEPEEVIQTVLSHGWTSISELFVNQERLNELLTLSLQDNLRIRINAYLPLSWQFERFGNWYQAYPPGYEYSSKLRIGGVKIFMDGWYRNPILYFRQTELDELVGEAHELGYQIAIHSVVDNATDIVLNSLETVLNGQSNENYRHRIEHLVLLRDDQIQRMKTLGIIASFQLPWFNSDWTDIIIDEIGPNKTHLVGRWRDLLQAGVPSQGSTDFPWNLGYIRSPMKLLSMAVTRIGEEGRTPTEWMLNQTLSVEQALRLITIDAAYGTFQEDSKGSIKVGKLSDLVVLSDDPTTVPENSLASIEVLMTMVGGVVEFCTPDQPALCVNSGSSTTLDSSSKSTTVTVLVSFIVLWIMVLRRKRKF